MPGSSVANLPLAQPQFWVGNKLAWSIVARVGGTMYNLMGVPLPTTGAQSAVVTHARFTATHTYFSLTAGDANITLDFFSPVSFHNYTRQSLPFSYLTVSAVGLDGAKPIVQIYSDINESWTGQAKNTTSSFVTSGNASIFSLQATDRAEYTETDLEQALWGRTIFAGSSPGGKLTAASGTQADLRKSFRVNGTLPESFPDWVTGNVVALAYNLGTITKTTSCTFAIGYERINTINYLGQSYTGYYRAKYPTYDGAVEHFFKDYPDALAESTSLDNTIQTIGETLGGQNYSDILALSVRQTFGGIDLTIPNNTLDTSKAAAFIKEISSDGNINTVDIIVELIPLFYTFNPEWIKLLLNPVVDYLATGRWPHPWVIHDLGKKYPNATGHDDGKAEQQPVEETGNLLIMAAAYQAASGNKTWATSHKSLFDGYATWLSENGLYPTKQLSTNDGLGEFTNMTQLGVKAAVGLSAYGKLTGEASWTNTGNSFGSTICQHGVGIQTSSTTQESYFTITYGSSTYFMMFNLYPAKLLNLTCFPQSAYDGQSAFYPTVSGPYGAPLDGTIHWGKTDWQAWAWSVASNTTRQLMINHVHAYASNGLNDIPFSDRYWATGPNAGLTTIKDFRARPVLGAHFATWAIERPWQVIL